MDTDGPRALQLLLVEDDDGDALLVEELLLDAGLQAQVTRAWSLEAALDALSLPVDCVLLDLGLPDATGLDALVQLRAVSDAALVVLTGLDGIDRGVDAVAAGAQDYLVKGRVDGETLGRAVRYAVERRRGQHEHQGRSGPHGGAEDATALLHRLRPVPQQPAGVRARARTTATDSPRTTEMWDVVERPDGTCLVLFGSVHGTGPQAASQATTLAVSFRALALAGLDVRRTVETLDVLARPGQVPADAVVLGLDPRTRRVTVLAAGGGAPLHLTRSTVEPLGSATVRPPLGGGDAYPQLAGTVLAADDRLLLVGASPAAAAQTREATRRELLALLTASDGGGVTGDAVCDAVTAALRTVDGHATNGQVALLGWTPA